MYSHSTRRTHRHRAAKWLALGALAWLTASAMAQTSVAPSYELQVQVSGLQSDAGQVIANLFMRGDDLFGKPRAQQIQKSADRQAKLTFPKLSAGQYAVIAFHDVNGNNDLDHNMFKFPAEPLGYSNGFQLGLLSGVPNTEKLAFTVDAAHQSIHITVNQ